MVIHGQILNGAVVPEGELSLPEGTKVTILVRAETPPINGAMPPNKQARYLDALAKIDAVANENPSDNFSGADHDQALYGDNA